MKIINDIPIEIVNYIIEFKFGKCNKCNQYSHFDDVLKNCRIIKYKSVFHDSYWIDEIVDSFSLICKPCVKKYSGKNIIDMGENIYKWVDQY